MCRQAVISTEAAKMDRIMVTDQRLRILHPPTGSLRILTLITEPFFISTACNASTVLYSYEKYTD